MRIYIKINLFTINKVIMSFTTSEKVNYLFKRSMGAPSTRDDLPFFQEPSTMTRSNVYSSQVWNQSDSIPTECPSDLRYATTDDSSNAIEGSTTGKTSGVVKKYVKLLLEEVTNSNGNAYQAPLVSGVRPLQNVIPFNFNSYTDDRTYQYKLYKNDGTTEISNGDGEWVLDTANGILTFYDLGGISGVSAASPPKITFYKYVGNTGVTVSPSETFSNNILINTSEPSQGVKFNWTQASTSTNYTGFFGFENSLESFVYIPQSSTDSDGSITGSYGNGYFGKVGVNTTTMGVNTMVVNGYIKGQIGIPTSGTFSSDKSSNVSEILSSDLISEGLYKVSNLLNKIVPTKPPNLSTKMITLQNAAGVSTIYNAYEAGTSTINSNVTKESKPRTNVITNFFSADSGVLSATIKDSSSAASTNGSITLTSADNSGTNGYLVISSEADYYAGQAQKENVWKVLNCYLEAPSNLTDTTLTYSYQLGHSLSGNTNTFTFNLDDAVTPSFSQNPEFDDDGIVSNVTNAEISGVKTLASGATIKVDIWTAGTIKSYYNYTYGLAGITGSEIATSLEKDRSGRNVSTYITDSAQDFELSTTISSGVYTEQLSVEVKAYNSKDESVSYTLNTKNSKNIRVDTISTTSYQVQSGVDEYPSSYGSTYLQSTSLLSNQELQMINNKYQKPLEVDYSTYLPSGSPNYTTVNSMLSNTDPYRYVTFKYTFTAKDEVFLVFTGQEGTNWGESETLATLMRFTIRIVDSTSDSNWLDANKFFTGNKVPNSNGDGVLTASLTTAAQKHLLLGTTRSGDLYVRVGFVCKGTTVSDKKFTSIGVYSTSQL